MSTMGAPCAVVVERGALCRGDIVFFLMFLGESLARFDDRGVFTRPETAFADAFERVDYAYREGIVGRDDVIIDFGMGEGESFYRLGVHIVDIYVFGDLRSAGVALHTIQFIHLGALFKG